MGTHEQQLQSKSISAADWKKLSAKRIYFGHMSVGYNIIDGIKDLIKSNPSIVFNIRETNNPADIKNGVFAHSQNGENVKPKTKVDTFVKTMDSGMAKQVDIAFFKFCYVDFNKDTDVAELFRYYTSAMDALQKKYPKVIFIHATSPITTEGELISLKTRIKDLIKSLLSRESNLQHNVTGNLKRNEFNVLLRKKYDSRYIIDIEKYESTNPDGSPYTSDKGGSMHNVMVPAYTFDGGHLNEAGRLVIADKFIAKLAGVR